MSREFPHSPEMSETVSSGGETGDDQMMTGCGMILDELKNKVN